MNGQNNMAVEAAQEQLIETGPTDITSVFARAFELAMRIEREGNLEAGHCKRAPTVAGLQFGAKDPQTSPEGTFRQSYQRQNGRGWFQLLRHP